MTRACFAKAFDLCVRFALIGGVSIVGFLLARVIGPGAHA